MINPVILVSGYLIVLASLGFLAYSVIRSFFIVQAIKKFAIVLQQEIRTELTNDYMKLMQGDIEVEDFYQKQEWLGQLFIKIFEDYKNNLMKNYFKSNKGRMKVK